MAKRSTGLAAKRRKKPKAHKTAKRLAKKREMLASKTKKRS